MKFNLKNRPKLRTCSIQDYGEFARQYAKETSEWFEGFEKELREMLESGNSEDEKLLKEILGDACA